MEAAHSTENTVNICQTIRCHISERSNIRSRRRENLGSLVSHYSYISRYTAVSEKLPQGRGDLLFYLSKKKTVASPARLTFKYSFVWPQGAWHEVASRKVTLTLTQPFKFGQFSRLLHSSTAFITIHKFLSSCVTKYSKFIENKRTSLSLLQQALCSLQPFVSFYCCFICIEKINSWVLYKMQLRFKQKVI
jgi:hypothetical protein